jgi:hypothetical protein
MYCKETVLPALRVPNADLQAAAPGIAVVLFALNLFWFKKILAGILQAVAGAKCSVRKET